ncbi:hypothetical protein CHARACLAT_008748 [Characodon lateralis]|uniref:Uncharacterized protein n=1 Tax=Characodon lateralis TaxID=208331 RepID=A0ABU7ESL7_9TELE|nr:hypothetical protein [Characodon lateralis]
MDSAINLIGASLGLSLHVKARHERSDLSPEPCCIRGKKLCGQSISSLITYKLTETNLDDQCVKVLSVELCFSVRLNVTKLKRCKAVPSKVSPPGSVFYMF